MINIKQFELPTYKVKFFPIEELDKVQKLYSQAFGGREISQQSLLWQMEKNPCLKERAVSLWEEETLVAYSALTPFCAILRNKEIFAAVSGTTMASDDFLGASFQLIQEVQNNNQDIHLIYGFPNRNSFGICVKYLHHHYVGDIAFWTAIAEKRSISKCITEFRIFTDDKYEIISRNIAVNHVFIKLRNSEFLNWRFFDKPDNAYKGFELIVDNQERGYIIVNTYVDNGVKQLQIVDILSDSLSVFKQLLQFAINLAYECNCASVKLWLTSALYAGVLKECGFTYGDHPFKMTVWNEELDISQCYMTMGDSDIF